MAKRRILVPVDGTEFSYRIFPVIMDLLDAQTSEIVLLTVRDRISGHIGAPPRALTADGYIKSYENAGDYEQAAHPIYASQERDSALAEFRSKTQAYADPLEVLGFHIGYEIRFGDPAEEIVDYVENNRVDLIAMATHWRTGLDRLFNGNTLTGIIPSVEVPLLVIRSDDDED